MPVVVRVRNLGRVWLGSSLLGPLIQLPALGGRGRVAWPAVDADLPGAWLGLSMAAGLSSLPVSGMLSWLPRKPHGEHDFIVVTACPGDMLSNSWRGRGKVHAEKHVKWEYC